VEKHYSISYHTALMNTEYSLLGRPLHRTHVSLCLRKTGRGSQNRASRQLLSCSLPWPGQNNNKMCRTDSCSGISRSFFEKLASSRLALPISSSGYLLKSSSLLGLFKQLLPSALLSFFLGLKKGNHIYFFLPVFCTLQKYALWLVYTPGQGSERCL
jgi:hypothetical protein